MDVLLGSGLQELGLVIFTAVAPSGAIAVFIMACIAMLTSSKSDDFMRLSRYLVIPVSVCLVGFIASTFQLGTPSNALYVFLGVGRSPMSNEVFAAVVFLGLAGTYWLASFNGRLPVFVAKPWLFLIAVAAVVGVSVVSVVYSVPTIPTWNSVYVPANLWLSALVGGPVLALLTLRLSGLCRSAGFRYAMLAVSAVALLLNASVLFAQSGALDDVVNSLHAAVELVPAYSVFAGVYFVLALFGLLLVWFSERSEKTRGLPLLIMGNVLVFLGILLTRVQFYSMYMTVGF